MFGLDSGVGVFITIIAMAVVFLKFFDQVAGRGSKQVKDGINKSSINKSENRVPCPHCAEAILPAAKKCPFCKSDL